MGITSVGSRKVCGFVTFPPFAAWIAWWGEHSRVTVAAVTVAFFGAAVSRFCAPDPAGRTLLRRVIERFGLS